MRQRRWMLPALAIASALGVGGCGGEAVPPLAKVHGKVTYNGKPLAFGRVIFSPTGAGPAGARIYPASGDIGPEGTFTLTTNSPGDGAAIGEHKVVLNVFDQPNKSGRASGSLLKSLVPKKYADVSTTPLTKTVASGDNAIDIELID